MSATTEERLSRLETEVVRLARQVSSSAPKPDGPEVVTRPAPSAKPITLTAPTPVAPPRRTRRTPEPPSCASTGKSSWVVACSRSSAARRCS